MGLLGRMAMKKEYKRLAPFFRGDERFIQTDVMDSVTVKWQDDGRIDRHGQAALTLTNRAIHVRLIDDRSGNVTRIPYEHLFGASAAPQRFSIQTIKAEWLFTYRGSPMGADNYEVIIGESARFTNVKRLIEVPGGKVMAFNKPVEEDGPAVWILATVPADLDTTVAEVRDVLTAELADEIKRWGPLPD